MAVNDDIQDFYPFSEDCYRVVIVGERSCGKSTFISEFYEHGKEPKEINYDNGVMFHRFHFEIHEEYLEFAVFEIPADDQFSSVKKLHQYENAFLIIFMYAIDDPPSLDAIADRWLPEISPVVIQTDHPCYAALLGNKLDLRNDPEVIERLHRIYLSPVTLENLLGFPLPEMLWDNPIRLECSCFEHYDVFEAWLHIFAQIFDF